MNQRIGAGLPARDGAGPMRPARDGTGFRSPREGEVERKLEAGSTRTRARSPFGGTARAVTALAIFCACAAPAGAAARDATGSAAQVFVDRDWSGAAAGREVAAGRFAGLNAFATIQSAVDAAPPGGTVNVAAGTYVEQVVISGKNLTLAGAGAGVTKIASPAVLPLSFSAGGFANKPVVLCQSAAAIRVTGLTVDGDGQGNANSRFMGVAYHNAGGSLSGVEVVGVRNTPLDNVQHGFGVYCQNSGGGPYALELDGVTVADFQKSGMLLNGAGMTVDVHDCVIAGAGDITVIAQNGLQLGSGAGGSIRDCALSDLRYVPAIAVSGALLIFMPGADVSLSGFTGANAFSNVQSPIRWYDGNGSIDGVEVTGPVIESQDFGPISISNFSGPSGAFGPARVTAPPGLPPADPVVEDAAGIRDGFGVLQTMAAKSVAVSNLCLTGGDVAGTSGIYAYSTGGPLMVTVTGSVLHDWDYGIRVVGAATTVSVSHSSLASNLIAAFDNSGGSPQVVENNWWGDASGPSGAGAGSGDAITGPNVDFTPWLTIGANGSPGCGFAPVQVIAASTADACISTAAPCATFDVTIARTTAEHLRGFSIPVQLSANLQLCAGPSSITEGTYLSGAGATYFAVTDHGGGSYTVDGVILGLPCGATASTGTLFSLQVAKAPEPDGTGTVTIGTPVLRDCDNAMVAAIAGAPGTILLDTTGPAAIANATAAQVKTGNDTDGTTKIAVSFTPPGDAASVEVYHAGFGGYPEYDGVPGSGVPAVPGYPPGAPWALTGVTAGGQSDEVATRDFWYYVVFTKDACGNVSGPSNRTAGTLNYHLGDVSNGFVAGQGNNSVLAEDVSLLGAHYPALFGAADPFAYLDVGPTTDFSVNGRPTTDQRVDFEDLIVFALNYNLVSAPLGVAAAELPPRDALSLDVPVLPEPGGVFDVTLRFAGRGDVQGASIALEWDPAVVAPIAATRGALLAAQGREALFMPAGPGAFDLALLGRGGLAGSGELARLAFRVIGEGDPGIALERVIARNGDNLPVVLQGGDGPAPVLPLPARTAFGAVAPNPSPGGPRIELALATAGHVGLAVFDLSGRRVRTLLDEAREPGVHRVAWDGRDDTGARAPAGFYVLRLEAGGVTATRRITIVR